MCRCERGRISVGRRILWTCLTGWRKTHCYSEREGAVCNFNVNEHNNSNSTQNIVKVELTETKIYALSAFGKVYVLAADALAQATPASNPPTNISWYNMGWLLGNYRKQNIQYEEVTPKEILGWNEK